MIGKAKKRLNALTAPSKIPITKPKVTFKHEYDNIPALSNPDYESESDDDEATTAKHNPSPSPTKINPKSKPALPFKLTPLPLSQPPSLPPRPKAIPGSPKDKNKVKISLQNKIGQRIDGKIIGKYELCPENISMFIQ